MANIIIGMNGAIGPVCSTPNTPLSQPHWNTATTTPYAAPIESRFMTAALSGTSRVRNTTISSRKLSTSTAPMKSGSRAASRSRDVDARRGEPADVHRARRCRVAPRDHVVAQRRRTRSVVRCDLRRASSGSRGSPPRRPPGCGVGRRRPRRRRASAAARVDQPSSARGVGARRELGREEQRAVEARRRSPSAAGRRPGASCRLVGLLPASGKPRRIESSGIASTSRISEAAERAQATGGAARRRLHRNHMRLLGAARATRLAPDAQKRSMAAPGEARGAPAAA